MKTIKKILKKIIPKPLQHKIIYREEYLRIISIRKALKCQRLLELYNKLELIVPDISNQYSNVKLNSTYFKTKVRAEHAFQISLVQEALELLQLKDKRFLTIADIGDSCGTHLQYLRYFYKDINPISVNLDPKAIERIEQKGMKAIYARVEDPIIYSLNADLYLSFEMLEHLFDPISFLYGLSHKTECKGIVITVPYLVTSRVGLRYIRVEQKTNAYAENVHIFELSPADWKLIFKHSGWSVMHERVYLQYPEKGLFSFMKRHWNEMDYEGFYGAVLVRDFSWSDLYKDWRI